MISERINKIVSLTHFFLPLLIFIQLCFSSTVKMGRDSKLSQMLMLYGVDWDKSNQYLHIDDDKLTTNA